jgi:hypothetical protein
MMWEDFKDLIQGTLEAHGKKATEMNEPKLLANRIITPDGTLLQSFSRHDYKTHIDANGKEYMVDGGLEYRRGIYYEDAPPKDACVYSDDPHTEIREAFHWGSYGKGGDQPLKRLKLSEMSNNHIEAILVTQHHIGPHIRKVFEDEQQHRRDNNINIEDTE